MSNQLQISGAAKIRSIQGPVVANSGVITALDGDASQYVRGDGTLADFPTSTGGGSSVSYYLNTSISQGTIGGVAYKQLSKVPISGAGTDVSISANGYIASYLTDANDPALLEVPAGNFNCEFYFSVNSDAHNPYVYAEVYKYDGTTFTLLGSSVSVPEYLTNGTTLSPYYFAIPVATSVLTITDRIAVRIYVNVDGRTVTLHTENNHLCQVVTTFSKGLTTLNSLTRQVQFFATGTSGTDFAISSSVATHTFNLPVASASNTGKLSSTDWSTFNGKVPYTGATANVDLGAFSLSGDTISGVGIFSVGSGTQSGYIGIKQGTTFLGNISGYNSINANATKFILISDIGSTNYKSASFQLSSLTNNTERTYTLPDATGTLALLEGAQTFTGSKTFSSSIKADSGILLKNGFTTYSNGYTSLGGDIGNLIISSSIGGTPYDNEFSFTSSTSNTYTFPNASGTIALTSNLSSYLPLAGGTLTGALSGTSATFSGDLTIDTNTLYVDSTNNRVGIGTTSPESRLQVFSGQDVGTGVDGFGQFKIRNSDFGTRLAIHARADDPNLNDVIQFKAFTNNGSIAKFSFNGATTFSSSVTATQGKFSGSRPQGIFTENGTSGLYLRDATGTGYKSWSIGTNDIVVGFAITPSTAVGGTTFTTPSFVINESGNVGIGTSTPIGKLNVKGGRSIVTATASDSNIFVEHTGSLGVIGVTYDTGGAYYPLAFNTSDTERMRITSGGYLKASNTGSYNNSTGNQHEFNQSLGGNATMVVRNFGSTNGSGIICFTPSADTSEYFFAGSSGGSTRVLIYTNGNIVNTNNSYGPISDIKLKENIVDATPKLDDLMKVRIVNYNLKSDLGYESSKQIGVIAQELEQVFAGLVDEHIDRDSEGNDLGTTTKSVKMSVFVPMLIKAMQEQQAQIQELNERLNKAGL